uniref:Putative amino-acid permease n=1 Tax=Talaromyces marneffei PM1 TaxID=1077442 RepID=A0A093V7Y0_TALMA
MWCWIWEGEMKSQFPIQGGQFALADRFVSRELGFATGILYWYNSDALDSVGGEWDRDMILWRDGVLVLFNQGGAKGRFLGFFSVLIHAAFAFIGTDITAMASVETANVGLLVSPSDLSLNLSSTAAKSPFVIAIKNAGIPALPSIINAAILTSAWSSGCADLFVSSRTLYGLAARGHAPKIFLKTRKDGLPWVSVIFCGAFSLLSFMAASKGEEGTVFGYCKNFPLALIPWDILARFPV